MEENSTLEKLTTRFSILYDAFVKDCAAAENAGKWDTAQDGPMEGYAFAALSGAILALIVSDGNVGEREVDYFNRTFGFDYTVDELLGLYRFSARDLRENAVPNVSAAYCTLSDADSITARDFRELMRLACRIVSESDDGVLEEENALIHELEKVME